MPDAGCVGCLDRADARAQAGHLAPGEVEAQRRTPRVDRASTGVRIGLQPTDAGSAWRRARTSYVPHGGNGGASGGSPSLPERLDDGPQRLERWTKGVDPADVSTLRR